LVIDTSLLTPNKHSIIGDNDDYEDDDDQIDRTPLSPQERNQSIMEGALQ
jgi:hypothetical protein